MKNGVFYSIISTAECYTWIVKNLNSSIMSRILFLRMQNVPVVQAPIMKSGDNDFAAIKI